MELAAPPLLFPGGGDANVAPNFDKKRIRSRRPNFDGTKKLDDKFWVERGSKSQTIRVRSLAFTREEKAQN